MDVGESGEREDSIQGGNSELVEITIPEQLGSAIHDEEKTQLSDGDSVFKSVDEEESMELEDGRDEDSDVDLEMATTIDNEDHSHD
jgi:hypothetical protein